MKKQSIDVQNILAAALLNFDKFDNLDLDVINELLIKDKNIYIAGEDITDIDEFIEVDDGIATLKCDLPLSHKIDDETLEDRLKKIAGEELLTYVSNIDMEIFTLKKLKRVGNTPIDNIAYVLNLKQQETLESLIDDYCILLVWHESNILGPHLDVVVSSFGSQRVFEHDNKEQVDEFRQTLEREGLNPKFVGEFLRTQELYRPVKQVLSVSNFKEFTEKYGDVLEEDKEPYVKKHK